MAVVAVVMKVQINSPFIVRIQFCHFPFRLSIRFSKFLHSYSDVCCPVY